MSKDLLASIILLKQAEPQLWKLLVVKVVKKQIVGVVLCQLTVQLQLQVHLPDHPLTWQQVSEPPRVAAPEIPTSTPQSDARPVSTTIFSTIQTDVRAGTIRVEISDPEQWSSGDVAILKNQEAKRVGDIGSLIFETPIQHDYEAGVEVRSLLSTELVEDIDGRLAVTDVDPSGNRFVKLWIDELPGGSVEEPTAPLGGEPAVTRSSHSQFTVPPFPFRGASRPRKPLSFLTLPQREALFLGIPFEFLTFLTFPKREAFFQKEIPKRGGRPRKLLTALTFLTFPQS